MQRIILSLPLLVLVLLLVGCAEKENAALSTERFNAIFDNNQFDLSYKPIDMVQTLDGGYLILGGKDKPAEPETEGVSGPFTEIYLLKVNKLGNFERELEVPGTLVHPVGRLTAIGDKYFFIAMDNNVEGQLISIDQNLESLTNTPLGITYPMAMAFVDNQSFLVQSYNHVDQETVITLFSQTGTVINQMAYPIGVGDKDLNQIILDHFLPQREKIPFDVGKTATQYYFNGFINYTLSLVFTDFNNENPPRVEGQQENGGFSALTPLTGNKFAASRFNFGDNYLLPNVVIDAAGSPNINDDVYSGLYFRELVLNAPVKIHRATLSGKPVVIYGSNTISKQIGLYVYDENNGALLGTKYLGFSNTYEIANIITTTDGGLAISGVAYMAGRFPRICLFKLSKADADALAQ